MTINWGSEWCIKPGTRKKGSPKYDNMTVPPAKHQHQQTHGVAPIMWNIAHPASVWRNAVCGLLKAAEFDLGVRWRFGVSLFGRGPTG